MRACTISSEDLMPAFFSADDGRVYTWGSQPGDGPNTSVPIALPQPLKALSGVKIVKVAAGWAHTAFITGAEHRALDEPFGLSLLRPYCLTSEALGFNFPLCRK